ncbi:28407_t:CDS:2, partial [Racocetra persica]
LYEAPIFSFSVKLYIIAKVKSTSSSYIRFELSGYVSYSGGSENSSYDFTFWDNAIFKSSTSTAELSRVRSDYYSLQSSYSSLQSRNSNLQSEVYSLQSRNSSLQSEVSGLRSQNSAKDGQIATLNSKLANVQNQLKNKEGELMTTKKGLEELRSSFNNLTIASNDKDHELRKKERKIRELKELLGKTREEVIEYKLKSKESNLEVLMEKLEISRAKVRELQKAYQQLVSSQENGKQNEIDVAEDKVEDIKDELLEKKIDENDVRKFFRKCESIAKLKVEQDKLYKERFEAKQE